MISMLMFRDNVGGCFVFVIDILSGCILCHKEKLMTYGRVWIWLFYSSVLAVALVF